MDLRTTLETLLAGQDLDGEAMRAATLTLMQGQTTPAQSAAFLIALRTKGETAGEIAAAARVMRELATPIDYAHPHLVDTCGTGGDGTCTFNISTTVAFVAAAAGCRVAKHGNRSVSSRSGSADLLEAAGVRLDLSPEQVRTCIDRVGVGFLYAPAHHSAMRHVAPVRKELGVRTLFNLLGPLTNPAGAQNQVLGVYAAHWVPVLAEVLRRLGSRHVLVVHAEDGLDEFSLNAPTRVAELVNGEIRSYTVAPEDFGLARAPLSALAADGPEQSLELVRAALAGSHRAARDIVCLNAGAAIYAAGIAETLADGVQRARAVIADGSARARLDQLIALTRSF